MEDARPRRKLITANEAAILFVCILAVALGTLPVVSNIKLRRDKTASLAVAAQVVAAIHTQNGTAAYKLASPAYQKTYPAAELTRQFKSIAATTRKSPGLIDTWVTTTSGGRNVLFLYKYTVNKVPFYVRVTVQHQGMHYYLTDISGNADASTLL